MRLAMQYKTKDEKRKTNYKTAIFQLCRERYIESDYFRNHDLHVKFSEYITNQWVGSVHGLEHKLQKFCNKHNK